MFKTYKYIYLLISTRCYVPGTVGTILNFLQHVPGISVFASNKNQHLNTWNTQNMLSIYRHGSLGTYL
jgi:hypothetical protein